MSVDQAPVDPDLVHRSEFTRAGIPDEIELISWDFLSEQPSTNPPVVLEAACWWYIHGTGESDPMYCWATERIRHLTIGKSTADGLFGECRQYLRSPEYEDIDQ